MHNALVNRLVESRAQIAGLGVSRLALFGPAARGEALPPKAEVHLLAEMTGPPTFNRFLALRDLLSGLLDRPVELVLENPAHPQIWPYVQDDLVEILK